MLHSEIDSFLELLVYQHRQTPDFFDFFQDRRNLLLELYLNETNHLFPHNVFFRMIYVEGTHWLVLHTLIEQQLEVQMQMQETSLLVHLV